MTNTIEKLKFEDGEIDLKDLFKSFYRRKNYLLISSSLFLILGIIYAYNVKPKWEGIFQIVIRQNQESESLSSRLKNFDISNGFSGISGSTNDLKTEVEILESPSLLNPIYEFVKSIEKASGKDVGKWNFSDWRKDKLNIELKKGTSVLNLTYRDKNKDIVLPVLNKISSTYQKYSRSEREKGINQSITYLEKQILKMKVKSRDSLSKLQAFSIKNGLGNRDGLPLVKYESSNININKQILGSNKSLTNNFSKEDILQDRYKNQYNKLSNLETLLVEKSLYLTQNSNYIKELKAQISNLKSSLSREPEILLSYRILRNEALRDERVFFQLQNELTSLKLQQAKQTNPWELITKPTLIDDPIRPGKKKIAFLSLISGSIIGMSLVLFIDKKSDIIYNFNSFNSKINYPLLKTLDLLSPKLNDSINLLSKSFKENNYNSIALVLIGEELKQEKVNMLLESLNNNTYNTEFLVTNNLIESSKCSTQVLVVTPGTCTNNNLNQILEDLVIQKTPVEGWIFINS